MTLPWTPSALSERLSLRVSRIVILERLYARDASDLLRLELHGELTFVPKRVILKRWRGPALQSSATAELRWQLELAPAMRPTVTVPPLAASADVGDGWLLMRDLSHDHVHPSLPLQPQQLEAAVDLLVAVHAHWWQHPRLERADLLQAVNDVTRMPQALALDGIRHHAALAARALERFHAIHSTTFDASDWRLLERWLELWPGLFAERIQGGSRNVTLMHGDFHLLGNAFFAVRDPTSLQVTDWAQHKRGIGVHDLAYMLLSASDDDRITRDQMLIKRYQTRLAQSGVENYDVKQCLWDYRFCLLTNLFQSVFQNSPRWLRRNLDVVRIWQLEDWIKVF